MSSFGGKEPELVREVERYRLEIVQAHLQRTAWALEPSSLRGAGPSTTLELPRPPCVGVHPGEREGRFHCTFGSWKIGLLLLFVPTGLNGSTEYPAFLETLGGVLDSDSIVLLGGRQHSHG
ncbi:hypothetical protein L3Q82_025344 [Scortum barcoo]|uniref:Uncharacterized protein n=1 Tax=Scortum barcoo TaxID=214431 RepID=A0ACB8WP86_9TELE|nr:hypothetical protein L3Q82_025344 [Scortum barcoo]